MKIKFEPRNLWVGLHWHIQSVFNYDLEAAKMQYTYRYYICIIPMFQIIFDLKFFRKKNYKRVQSF